MLKIKEIIEEGEKLIACKTSQGELREGVIVTLDPNYKGELNPFFLRSDREYKIVELLKDDIYNKVFILIKGYEEEPVYCDYLNIIKSKSKFDVFKWKGYYILANSIDQASEIWEKSNLPEKELDQKLFPHQLKRLKAEADYPCIVNDLDWEETLFELN